MEIQYNTGKLPTTEQVIELYNNAGLPPQITQSVNIITTIK